MKILAGLVIKDINGTPLDVSGGLFLAFFLSFFFLFFPLCLSTILSVYLLLSSSSALILSTSASFPSPPSPPLCSTQSLSSSLRMQSSVRHVSLLFLHVQIPLPFFFPFNHLFLSFSFSSSFSSSSQPLSFQVYEHRPDYIIAPYLL